MAIVSSMQTPLQISFHGIGHSDALYNAIREKAAKLEHYFDRIVSCRVVLELGARHKRKGKKYTAHNAREYKEVADLNLDMQMFTEMLVRIGNLDKMQ